MRGEWGTETPFIHTSTYDLGSYASDTHKEHLHTHTHRQRNPVRPLLRDPGIDWQPPTPSLSSFTHTQEEEDNHNREGGKRAYLAGPPMQ
ncbi:hypothetical protein AAHC03_05872 [Spirometra sp. Aus1]